MKSKKYIKGHLVDIGGGEKVFVECWSKMSKAHKESLGKHDIKKLEPNQLELEER